MEEECFHTKTGLVVVVPKVGAVAAGSRLPYFVFIDTAAFGD